MNNTSIWKYLKEHEASGYADLRESLLSLYEATSDETTDIDPVRVLQNYCTTIKSIVERAPADSTHSLAICVIEPKDDPLCDESYVDVSLVNGEFVEDPDYTLKAWGGNGNDRTDAPPGYFNANWLGYYKRLGLGGTPWNDFIFSDLVIEESAAHLSIHDVIANALYEITFHGYTEERVKEFWEEMDERCKHAKAHPETLLEITDFEEYINDMIDEED